MRRKRERVKIGTENIKATGIVLTMAEACRLLHVHPNTLRRWSARGIVRSYRVGPAHHRRFKPEDIAVLLVEQPNVYQAKIGMPPKFPKRAKRAS